MKKGTPLNHGFYHDLGNRLKINKQNPHFFFFHLFLLVGGYLKWSQETRRGSSQAVAPEVNCRAYRKRYYPCISKGKKVNTLHQAGGGRSSPCPATAQPMRGCHNSANENSLYLELPFSSNGLFFKKNPWWSSLLRREWHPTAVLLLGKSHGRRSLVGCSPWGCYESDTTERFHFYFSLSCIGEGNGNPLQCSCLENPRDRGAWWAAVYGLHRVGRDWSDLAAAAASLLFIIYFWLCWGLCCCVGTCCSWG